MTSSVAEVKRLIADNKTRQNKKKLAPKPLPKNVTLEDIVKSLPSEVFTQDRFKSFGSLAVTLIALALSMWLLSVLPWYLWPVGWVLGGASVTGLFTIAHDCVHSSFAQSTLVNTIVGTIAMLPLGYSFESWKTIQKYHHKGIKGVSGNQYINHIWKWAKGPTYWLASIGHWAEQHVNLNVFNPQDRARVQVSFYAVYAFAAVFFSVLTYYTGLIGIVKYWLLPWMVCHFMVSTTTLLPSVVVEEKSKGIAVHVDYPKWLEFLSHDISLAIPRNVSTSIPHYHLRKAYNAIKQQWGEHFVEIKFELELLNDLIGFAAEPLTTYVPVPREPVAPPADEKKVKDGEIAPVVYEDKGVGELVSSAIAFMGQVNYLHAGILIATPLIALYGVFSGVPLTKATLVWSVVYYFLTGWGITAGYHRLFAHRAYKATPAFRFAIMMLGTGAVEGSVRWWCRDHRAHHRYTDTDKDPYSAGNGFWWSHIGWMMAKQDSKKIGRASIEDLNADPWIRWQHKHYIYLSILMGILVPTIIPGIFWGDWAGGYFYAAVARLIFVHHSTFMVNSLAHYLGSASYADNHTPRDSVITAVLTLGEGYHNFHHEFPQDYRNAIRFYQYDPTKWFIGVCSYFGLTYDLKRFPENEIQKGQVQMRQKLINKQKAKVDFGLTDDELPLVTKETFEEISKEGFKLIVIDDIVHDVTDFVDEHPGGKAIIMSMVGKDGTHAFRGGIYEHSNGANNLLSQLRVGKVDHDEWTLWQNPDSVDAADADAKKNN